MVDNQLNATLANAVTLNIHSDWTVVGTPGNKTVYRYKAIVPLNGSDTVLTPVFTTVTVSTAVVTEENIDDLDGKTIVIKAYAHQSNATDQTAADAARWRISTRK